eukprot:scaffold26254_cov59-Phaeocystis_antarctica.AAC.2
MATPSNVFHLSAPANEVCIRRVQIVLGVGAAQHAHVRPFQLVVLWVGLNAVVFCHPALHTTISCTGRRGGSSCGKSFRGRACGVRPAGRGTRRSGETTGFVAVARQLRTDRRTPLRVHHVGRAVPRMVIAQLAAWRAANLGGPCALRQVNTPDLLLVHSGPKGMSTAILLLVLHVVLACALVRSNHVRWMPLAASNHLDPRAFDILHTDGARPRRMMLQGADALAREGLAAARTVW